MLETSHNPFGAVAWRVLDERTRPTPARVPHLEAAAKIAVHRVRGTATRGGDVLTSFRAEINELICQALTLKFVPLGIGAAIAGLGGEVGIPDADVWALVGEIADWLRPHTDVRTDEPRASRGFRGHTVVTIDTVTDRHSRSPAITAIRE
jgi:hypothetical protein